MQKHVRASVCVCLCWVGGWMGGGSANLFNNDKREGQNEWKGQRKREGEET